ncbi:MAG TPA: polysaccharide deacetylase family protein [Longimicrobiales bacterium]|nr:polysaccharide deacetylase family protein [Longimicrobiales bacterium]
MRAILTYHSIDGSGSPISVDPAAFRRHVECLTTKGPRVVGMDELLMLPDDSSAVAITFDDAFVNFAELAWPLLNDHGLPVTLFVPTEHVGGTNAWSATDRSIPHLPLLDGDALARLAADGVTLGSHTCTHPHLTWLSAGDVRGELERSADQLQHMTGVRPSCLAYPYGAYNPDIAAAAGAIYSMACTTEMRFLRPGDEQLRLPRLDMYYLRSEESLSAWGSPRLRVYLQARARARGCRELFQSVTNR